MAVLLVAAPQGCDIAASPYSSSSANLQTPSPQCRLQQCTAEQHSLLLTDLHHRLLHTWQQRRMGMFKQVGEWYRVESCPMHVQLHRKP